MSLRWTKLPPVRPAVRGQAPVVPYMRYGHSTVLIDDPVFLWGGRNDTEGACNVLYAFDVSEYGSQMMPWGWGSIGEGKARIKVGMSPDLTYFYFFQKILTSGLHPECQEQFLGPGMDIQPVSWARSCTFLGDMSSW